MFNSFYIFRALAFGAGFWYLCWRFHFLLRSFFPKLKRWQYWIPAGALTVLFIAGQLFRGRLPGPIRSGADYSLGVLVYPFMILAAADVIRLLFKLFWKKSPLFGNKKAILCVGLAVIIVGGSFSTYGILHCQDLQTARYTVAVDKTGQDLRIAVVSDLHLGYVHGIGEVTNVVNAINAADPDVICIVGDIFDNDFNAVSEKEDIAAEFRQFKATYGVYAVLGNHDVGSTQAQMISFIESCNIHLLQDETASPDGIFTLIGRRDYGYGRQGVNAREDIDDLAAGVDFSKPVIVLDHQPETSCIADARDIGADLLLSGHTHAGQMFPANLLTDLQYNPAYGYAKNGSLQIVVTSGSGTWGPPLRVGTDSEVAIVQLTVNNAQ